MKTRKSTLRRVRALWKVAKPEPMEVLGVACIAAMFVTLMIVL